MVSLVTLNDLHHLVSNMYILYIPVEEHYTTTVTVGNKEWQISSVEMAKSESLQQRVLFFSLDMRLQD